MVNAVFTETQLYYAYRDFLNTPLEYLHESLGESGADFLYHYHQYMGAMQEMRRQLRREKAEKKAEQEAK